MFRSFGFWLLLLISASGAYSQFVTVKGHQFYADGKPYYFIGTNYWYGGLLGLEKDKKRGVERLRRELDFLKANGVTNLRLMAGAEGSGLLNGVTRVGPSLQTAEGKFDERVLDGLDLVLAEMRKRKMRAVIFLGNNWEWSGGFQQYLIWQRVISDEWLTRKPSWDELRDNVSKFYACAMCKFSYARQVARVVRRTNSVSGSRYKNDPTIMAWEIANEPRPMRPFAIEAYKAWIAETAQQLNNLAPKQLVTIGTEGYIGTEDISTFEQIHDNKNVDYLTIHVWPKNWGWFENGKMAEQFDKLEAASADYIAKNLAVTQKLNKPLVIEEFGLPRDGQSFDPAAATKIRDEYFKRVLALVKKVPHLAGANFWAFGGAARPIKGQMFWKVGDEYMGDPPMEEQGLYSVFDSDASTWAIVRSASKAIRK